MNRHEERDGIRTFKVRGRTWSDRETRLYLTKGYHGIIYEPWGRKADNSLDFLRDLPDLHALYLSGDIGDDRILTDIEGLRKLVIEYRSRWPIDLTGMSSTLEWLDLAWHPQMTLPTCPRLETLIISGYQASSFTPLGDHPRLKNLDLTIKRGTTVSVSGLKGLRSLESLSISSGKLNDWQDDSIPSSLRTAIFERTTGIDLRFAKGTPLLGHLYLERCGSVPSVQPLAECESLSRAALDHTLIEDDSAPVMERWAEFR